MQMCDLTDFSLKADLKCYGEGSDSSNSPAVCLVSMQNSFCLPSKSISWLSDLYSVAQVDENP